MAQNKNKNPLDNAHSFLYIVFTFFAVSAGDVKILDVP